MLILSRKLHESIIINDNIEIHIIDIKNDTIRIGIKAPSNIQIYRTEIYKQIGIENQEALTSGTDLPSLSSFYAQIKEEK